MVYLYKIIGEKLGGIITPKHFCRNKGKAEH